MFKCKILKTFTSMFSLCLLKLKQVWFDLYVVVSKIQNTGPSVDKWREKKHWIFCIIKIPRRLKDKFLRKCQNLQVEIIYGSEDDYSRDEKVEWRNQKIQNKK